MLQGPVGGCQTSLQTNKVTVPARCIANQEPILLEAVLVQLGSVTVSKTVAQTPVAIESIQASTIKLTVFRDESKIAWEQFCGAPLKYILQQFPLLRGKWLFMPMLAQRGRDQRFRCNHRCVETPVPSSGLQTRTPSHIHHFLGTHQNSIVSPRPTLSQQQ